MASTSTSNEHGGTGQTRPAVLFIIYGAFVMACLVYLGLIASGILRGIGYGALPEMESTLPMTLGIVATALMIAAGGLIAAPLATKVDENAAASVYLARILKRLVIRGAALESIALIGLMTEIFGLGRAAAYGLCATGLLGVLVLLPGLFASIDRFGELSRRARRSN